MAAVGDRWRPGGWTVFWGAAFLIVGFRALPYLLAWLFESLLVLVGLAVLVFVGIIVVAVLGGDEEDPS